MDEKDPLEQTEELFAFLQGTIPEGCHIAQSHIPRLTPDQAWTVIWYLGNLYWQVPDCISRCDMCGTLYNSERTGDCLDYGKAPYCFCDTCTHTDTWYRKAKRNPDKNARPD